MATRKMMFTVDEDTARAIDALKRDSYYNKSYAELCRQLLKLGLEQKAKETE